MTESVIALEQSMPFVYQEGQSLVSADTSCTAQHRPSTLPTQLSPLPPAWCQETFPAALLGFWDRRSPQGAVGTQIFHFRLSLRPGSRRFCTGLDQARRAQPAGQGLGLVFQQNPACLSLVPR